MISWSVGKLSNLFLFQIKDNKLNVDVVVEIAKEHFDRDDAKVQMIRDVANECASQTDSDRCEAAAKICNCMQKGCQARSLSFTM